jgi:leucyl aminopeptidase
MSINVKLNIITKPTNRPNLIICSESQIALLAEHMDNNIALFIQNQLEQKIKPLQYFGLNDSVFIETLPEVSTEKIKEKSRIQGAQLFQRCKNQKIKSLNLRVIIKNIDLLLPFLEGMLLSSYTYNKFKTKPEETYEVELNLPSDSISEANANTLMHICDEISFCRDLVNDPPNDLTAEKLSSFVLSHAKLCGYQAQILDKKSIEELNMGGLLAVNKGSQLPPTFSILEWKPEDAVNDNPIILVGKGVVYDTGGLSLKPTAMSMDFMKCDMAGAAVVITTIGLISKLKLPIHVVGLIPATDNRPGEQAYAPGDVIKMMSGSTVEVLNTDAEGRMILADALHFAKRYLPDSVIDIATLTGATAAALGPYAASVMGNDENIIENLIQSGQNTYERLVSLPLWEEYGDEIKSDIADIKNIGGSYGGAITAGKFLEHFTDYPWAHLDIAGVAFTHKGSNYWTKGGTGYGVRLLHDYLMKRIHKIQKND